MHMHRTRDGKVIAVADMTDSHLTNTIRFFRNKAKEGIQLWFHDDDGQAIPLHVLEGHDAEQHLSLDAYLAEAYRRNLPIWQGI